MARTGARESACVCQRTWVTHRRHRHSPQKELSLAAPPPTFPPFLPLQGELPSRLPAISLRLAPECARKPLDCSWSVWMTLTSRGTRRSVRNGSPSRPLLPLLQEQAVPQVEVQPWCPRPQGTKCDSYRAISGNRAHVIFVTRFVSSTWAASVLP